MQLADLRLKHDSNNDLNAIDPTLVGTVVGDLTGINRLAIELNYDVVTLPNQAYKTIELFGPNADPKVRFVNGALVFETNPLQWTIPGGVTPLQGDCAILGNMA